MQANEKEGKIKKKKMKWKNMVLLFRSAKSREHKIFGFDMDNWNK